MRTVPREEIVDDPYIQVIKAETDHDHEIIEDVLGILRWKASPDVLDLMPTAEIEELIAKCKNAKYDPTFKKMYRDLGISLFSYWELFYLGTNTDL